MNNLELMNPEVSPKAFANFRVRSMPDFLKQLKTSARAEDVVFLNRGGVNPTGERPKERLTWLFVVEQFAQWKNAEASERAVASTREAILAGAQIDGYAAAVDAMIVEKAPRPKAPQARIGRLLSRLLP